MEPDDEGGEQAYVFFFKQDNLSVSFRGFDAEAVVHIGNDFRCQFNTALVVTEARQMLWVNGTFIPVDEARRIPP